MNATSPSPHINLGSAERLASIAAGAGLVGVGIYRRSALTPFLALLGYLVIRRGTMGYCPAYQRFGINTNHTASGVPGGYGVKVEKTVFIARAPAQVYAWWRDM